MDSNELPNAPPIPRQQQNFPAFKATVPLDCSRSFLIDMFKKSCAKHGFYISEISNTSVTAIYNKKPVLQQLFSCLASQDKAENRASVVKLSIRHNQRVANSIVIIRGLQGLEGKIASVIESYKSLSEPLFASQSPTNRIKRLNSESDVAEPVLTRQVESYSYYELSKLLTSQEHGVGLEMHEFIVNWTEERVQKGVPEALFACKRVIDRAVEGLLSHVNIVHFTSIKVAQHCRPSVEKYLYSKVIAKLLYLYQEKYAETNESFKKKLETISTIEKPDLIELLEVTSI